MAKVKNNKNAAHAKEAAKRAASAARSAYIRAQREIAQQQEERVSCLECGQAATVEHALRLNWLERHNTRGIAVFVEGLVCHKCSAPSAVHCGSCGHSTNAERATAEQWASRAWDGYRGLTCPPCVLPPADDEWLTMPGMVERCACAPPPPQSA